MPSYNKADLSVYSDIESGAVEVGRFHIETKPLGFRGIKGLSWLLHLFPYVTGSKPKFCYQVAPSSQNLGDTFGVTLSRLHTQDEHIVRFTGVNIQGHYEDSFEDDMIAWSGEYSYKIEVHVSVYSAKTEIIAFKALAKDDVVMSVVSFIFLLLAAGIGSLLTWLLMR